MPPRRCTSAQCPIIYRQIRTIFQSLKTVDTSPDPLYTAKHQQARYSDSKEPTTTSIHAIAHSTSEPRDPSSGPTLQTFSTHQIKSLFLPLIQSVPPGKLLHQPQSLPMIPLLGGTIDSLNILFPHLLIHANQASIIRHQPIDLAFDIRSLCPDTAGTRKSSSLLGEIREEDVGAVVPYFGRGVEFVGFVYVVDGPLDLPETELGLVRRGYGRGRKRTVARTHCGLHHRIRLEWQCDLDRGAWKRWSRKACRIED